MLIWLFQKIIETPLLRKIGNFQEGRVKVVVEISGCMSKFEGKTRISKGVNAKKWKILGGGGYLNWSGIPGWASA